MKKLTSDDVQRIKELHECGVKKVELAKIYPVSAPRLTQILGKETKEKVEL